MFIAIERSFVSSLRQEQDITCYRAPTERMPFNGLQNYKHLAPAGAMSWSFHLFFPFADRIASEGAFSC